MKQFFLFVLWSLIFLCIPQKSQLVYGQKKEPDSLLVRDLQLQYAIERGLDKTVTYKMGRGEILRDCFYEYAPKSFLKLLERSDGVDRKKYGVKMLYKSLPQRMEGDSIKSVISFIDSVYYQLNNSSKNHLDRFIEDFSEQKDTVWLTEYQETEDFQQVLRALPIGEFSRPFVTAKGAYIIEKIGEREGNNCEEELIDLEALLKEYKITVFSDVCTIQSDSKELIKTPYELFTTESFAAYSLGKSMGCDILWHKYLLYVLGKTIESELSQNPVFMKNYRSREENILIDLAFKEYLNSNRTAYDRAFKSYLAEIEDQGILEYVVFDGLIVYSDKRRVLRRIKRGLKRLSADQWASYLDNFKEQNTKKGGLDYFMGKTKVTANDLTKVFFIDSSNLSKRKRRRMERKFYLRGKLEKEIKFNDSVKHEADKACKLALKKEWIQRLVGNKE